MQHHLHHPSRHGSHHTARRPSDSALAATSSSASAIPTPPPLPPPRYTARNALARIVQPFTAAYGASRPLSTQAHRSEVARPNPLLSRIPGVSSLSSQDASHKTGLEISALDINQDRTHAILAGREILKTVRIDGTRCSEDLNLRAAIRKYANENNARNDPSSAASRQRDTFDIHDVKWSHGAFASYVATAATSGRIFLYDLRRTGVELARMHEHHRQVHSLAFNPHQGYYLLSGSQDATVKIWDLRDLRRDIYSCPSYDKFSGLSDGVRNVKWSPTDGVEFAFGTDNGTIQRWDFRNNRGPKLKINAHDRVCNAIDWHPDGKYLLSASADKQVKVWDFSVDRRRQKARWTIRTPFPIANARWRPPSWSADIDGTGGWQTAQIATSYIRDQPVVHLWDFRRPFLPFREVSRYSTPTTDMLWHSRDLLWTVGREGVFTQTDIHFSPKIVDRRNMQSFALASSGDLGVFTQKRMKRKRAIKTYGVSATESEAAVETKERLSPEKGSLGRNSVDDSVDDSFLSSSYVKQLDRQVSNRSGKSLSSTPPSVDEMRKVISLQHVIGVRKESNKPDQIAFRGGLPVQFNLPIFTYLAQKYKSLNPAGEGSLDTLETVARSFEQNAEYAQKAALPRVSQSWKILGFVMSKVLSDKSQMAGNRVTCHGESIPKHSPQEQWLTSTRSVAPDNPGGPAASRELVREQLDSHATTPSAKPVASDATVRSDPQSAIVAATQTDAELKGVRNKDTDSINSNGQDDLLHNPVGTLTDTQGHDDWNKASREDGFLQDVQETPGSTVSASPSESFKPISRPRGPDRQNSDDSFAIFPASADSQSGISFTTSYAASGTRQDTSEDAELYTGSVGSRSGPGGRRSPMEGWSGNSRSRRRVRLNFRSRRAEVLTIQKSSAMPQGGRLPGLVEEADQEGSLAFSIESDAFTQSRAPTAPTISQTSARSCSTFDTTSPITLAGASYNESFSTRSLQLDGTSIESSLPQPTQSRSTPQLQASHQAPPPRQTLIIDRNSYDRREALDPAVIDPVAGEDTGLPFPASEAVNQLLSFFTNSVSDAQTASHILLLCMSLLPQSQAVLLREAVAIADAYASQQDGASPPDLRNSEISHQNLLPLAHTGINPLKAEAILSAYHNQLHALSLFNAATSLRRAAFPLFPSAYEQSLVDITVGAICPYCRSPMGLSSVRCENCARKMGPCPICCCYDPPSFLGRSTSSMIATNTNTAASNPKRKSKSTRVLAIPLDAQKKKVKNRLLVPPSPSGQGEAFEIFTHGCATPLEPPTPDPELKAAQTKTPLGSASNLWIWCPLCGHGGHTSCVSAWFAAESSTASTSAARSALAALAAGVAAGPTASAGTSLGACGACPTPGCLCDCVPGKWREERGRIAQANLHRRDTVVAESWVVDESRAVAGVKSVLNSGQMMLPKLNPATSNGNSTTRADATAPDVLAVDAPGGNGVGLGIGLASASRRETEVAGLHGGGGAKRVRVMDPSHPTA